MKLVNTHVDTRIRKRKRWMDKNGKEEEEEEEGKWKKLLKG